MLATGCALIHDPRIALMDNVHVVFEGTSAQHQAVPSLMTPFVGAGLHG